jgi:outer membrane biosynthesis protein TonB
VESLVVSSAGCLNHRRPPAPPATKAPVRIGGQIQAPTLIHRVEPYYPPTAVDARLQGMVILEAIVDRDGTVAEVKVLRSANTLSIARP